MSVPLKKFRIDVIENLLNLCIKFEQSYDSFYIMVGYLDKLIVNNFPKQMLDVELVSLTLLFIGSKVNEITPPTLREILYESDRCIRK